MGGLELSFKLIPVEKKIEVVSRVLSGEKIQPKDERNWSS